jgi:hypothetical protein
MRRHLKPTPASSPLLCSTLDRYGEPTHPDIVRDPNDYGSCPDDERFDDEVWAWVGDSGTTYVFWYLLRDGELRGVHARATSYVEAAGLARKTAETWLVDVVHLQYVDIIDGQTC